MIHFEWMVIDHVGRKGIYFRGTRSGFQYIFYWNPIKTLRLLFSGEAWFGWFPITVNHIREFRKK